MALGAVRSKRTGWGDVGLQGSGKLGFRGLGFRVQGSGFRGASRGLALRLRSLGLQRV